MPSESPTLLHIISIVLFSAPFDSVIVYKSSQRSKKVRLQHFFAPDKSTVTCLVYKKGCLYVGLVSGSVAVYSRTPGVSHAPVGLCEFLFHSLRVFVYPLKQP